MFPKKKSCCFWHQKNTKKKTHPSPPGISGDSLATLWGLGQAALDFPRSPCLGSARKIDGKRWRVKRQQEGRFGFINQQRMGKMGKEWIWFFFRNMMEKLAFVKTINTDGNTSDFMSKDDGKGWCNHQNYSMFYHSIHTQKLGFVHPQCSGNSSFEWENPWCSSSNWAMVAMETPWFLPSKSMAEKWRDGPWWARELFSRS